MRSSSVCSHSRDRVDANDIKGISAAGLPAAAFARDYLSETLQRNRVLRLSPGQQGQRAALAELQDPSNVTNAVAARPLPASSAAANQQHTHGNPIKQHGDLA